MSNTSEPSIEPSHADSSPISTVESTQQPKTISDQNIKAESEYEIRTGTPEDAKEISRLIGETWTKFFSYSVSPEDLNTYLSTSLSPDTIKKELEDSKNIFILAFSPTSPSEILGVAQLVTGPPASSSNGDENDKIELQRLYAHESTHGTGLGQLLINLSEEKGIQLAKRKIWLGVWEDNKRGIKFYEKVGFKHVVDVDEKFFWAGGSKRRNLVMEKDL